MSRRLTIIAFALIAIALSAHLLKNKPTTDPTTTPANKFLQNRDAYQRAANLILKSKETQNWLPLPNEYKRLSKSGEVLVLGPKGDRILMFDFEDDDEIVRNITYVERANGRLDPKTEKDDTMWTERVIDPHWQISAAMP